MNYRDAWATDASGNKFIFTVEMQRQLNEAGLPVTPESLSQLSSSLGGESHVTHQPSESQETDTHTNSHVAEEVHEEEIVADYEEPVAIQIDPQTGKYIGRIKWYNIAKGYGFISRGGGEDIFFHKTDMHCEADDLAPGTWILYDVEETKKGLEASEVELYKE